MSGPSQLSAMDVYANDPVAIRKQREIGGSFDAEPCVLPETVSIVSILAPLLVRGVVEAYVLDKLHMFKKFLSTITQGTRTPVNPTHTHAIPDRAKMFIQSYALELKEYEWIPMIPPFAAHTTSRAIPRFPPAVQKHILNAITNGVSSRAEIYVTDEYDHVKRYEFAVNVMRADDVPSTLWVGRHDTPGCATIRVADDPLCIVRNASDGDGMLHASVVLKPFQDSNLVMRYNIDTDDTFPFTIMVPPRATGHFPSAEPNALLLTHENEWHYTKHIGGFHSDFIDIVAFHVTRMFVFNGVECGVNWRVLMRSVHMSVQTACSNLPQIPTPERLEADNGVTFFTVPVETLLVYMSGMFQYTELSNDFTEFWTSSLLHKKLFNDSSVGHEMMNVFCRKMDCVAPPPPLSTPRHHTRPFDLRWLAIEKKQAVKFADKKRQSSTENVVWIIAQALVFATGAGLLTCTLRP